LLASLALLTIHLAQVDGSQLRDLKVQCSRSGLTVHVKFDQPFNGIIFSQNFYQVPQCTYVTSDNNGHSSYSFSVPHKGCGSRSQMSSKTNAAGNQLSFQRSLDVVDVDPLFVENTIIIQHDPDFQEAGDTARRLRCVWRQSLQKSVNAKMNQIYQPLPPLLSPANQPTLITVNYDYRSLNQLVDVQSGRGPLSLPARGFINASPTHPSLAIYLKDPSKGFDAAVLGCSYSSTMGESIQLTDTSGCVLRPDLITRFYKMKESSNPQSDLTLYTYFKAFKIPNDNYFNISCSVEVCQDRCKEHCRHPHV